MSKVQVQPGKILDLTAPGGGVVSGSPYMIGNFPCIAQATADAGQTVAMAVEGVHEIPIKTGVDFTEGEAVYLESGEGSDVDSSPKFGDCVKAADQGAGDTVVQVKLNSASADL